jgi:cytochrome c
MKKALPAVLPITLFLTLLYGCKPEDPASQVVPVSVTSAPVASQVVVPTHVDYVNQEPKAEAMVQSGVKERELAQKSGCFACHTIEKKLVGPAWNDVSAKYRGQKDAEAKLIAKVAKGGGGVWGSVPMPPNAPKVAEADIKTLVRFILSRK